MAGQFKMCAVAALLCAQIIGPSVYASRCTTEKLAADKVIKHFQEKSETNDSEAKEILRLLKLSRDVIGIDSYELCKEKSFAGSMANFRKYHISWPWSKFISSKSQWDHSLPAESVARIKSERELLSNLFGKDSYNFAWVEKIIGNASGAKNILKSEFEKNYKYEMEKTETERSSDNPISYIERVYQALKPMATASEQIELERKIKKIKIHLSNIPGYSSVT